MAFDVLAMSIEKMLLISRFEGAMITGGKIMQDLQKIIMLLLSIVFCLTNVSSSFGTTYTVDNPGWVSVDYTFTNIPADAKITNVKVEYSYSHCPYDDVKITISKRKGDAAPILLREDGVSLYVSQTSSIWNSPVNYYTNSKANDVWTLKMAITSNGCPSSTCNPSYSGHSATFTPLGVTITYDHTRPTVISPVNRFFTGSSTNFQWSLLPNSDNYKLRISDVANVIKEKTTASTSFNTITDSTLNLQPMHKYNWSVAGNNAVGTGLFSDTRSFIIGQAECWPEVGLGFGVTKSYDHFDTCYVLNSNPEKYQMKDISRRENMNIDGHNGHMSSTASIMTKLYTASGPMEDPDNTWWDSGQKNGVDAHVNAGKVYDYLNRTFYSGSTPSTSFDIFIQNAMHSYVESTVSIACPSYIAFFSPYYPTSTINYCKDYSASSNLGIVAHEWAHAVTSRASDRGVDVGLGTQEGSSMNEAFSDWIAIAVKQDATGDYNDWIISLNDAAGNIILKRDLSNPYNSLPYPQPKYYGGNNWRNWLNEGDQYRNMGVPNQMFYFLVKGIDGVGGVGIDKAIKIAFWANMKRWNKYPAAPNLTFLNARVGMIDAAKALYPGIPSVADQVGKAWDTVGVTSTSTPQSLVVKRMLPTIIGIILDAN